MKNATVPPHDVSGREVKARRAHQRPVVLGIKGSPRRGGNSDRLLDAALASARSAGVETRVLIAAECGLRPCLGCNACSGTGDCVVEDTGAAVYSALDDADAIIVATPVYFATVPAVLKVLIDRLQPYWARRYVLGVPITMRRPGGILIARAGGDPYGSECTEAVVRSALAILGVDVVAASTFTGLDAFDELDRVAEPLARAAETGRLVAEEAVLRSDSAE